MRFRSIRIQTFWLEAVAPPEVGLRVGGMNVSLLLPTFILPFGLLGRVDNGHQHLTGSWRFGTLGRRLQGLRLQLVYGI